MVEEKKIVGGIVFPFQVSNVKISKSGRVELFMHPILEHRKQEGRCRLTKPPEDPSQAKTTPWSVRSTNHGITSSQFLFKTQTEQLTIFFKGGFL